MMLEIPLKFTGTSATLKLQAQYDSSSPEMLFDIELQNLTFTEDEESTTDDEESTTEDEELIVAYEHYKNTYQMFLRYDSETGLIYIQEGMNDSWHLLNYQTDNNSGAYILKTANIFK
jgi:hypothetical protein